MVYYSFVEGSAYTIDGSINFPHINPTRTLVPHEDALVLVKPIRGFRLHIIMIDLGSVTYLLHALTYKKIGYPPVVFENLGRVRKF